MKKLLLLTIATAFGVGAFAQSIAPKHNAHGFTTTKSYVNDLHSTARTTDHYDTVLMANAPYPPDSLYLYYAGSTTDSGWTSGINQYGDQQFAERYDFTSADSTVEVVGVRTVFGGSVNAASTKTVTFKVWTVAAQSAIGGNYYYSGLPDTAIDSITNVPVTTLGVGPGGSDTVKTFLFSTFTGFLTHSFFIGYSINYNPAALAGDTVGLLMSGESERHGVLYTVSGTDTIVNDEAVVYNDGFGGWDDNIVSYGNRADYLIYPIVISHIPTTGLSITNRGFTFHGNYPNPAVSNTNIQFTLANASDVFVDVTDMSGRVMKTMTEKNLSAGDHTINLVTSDLAAGDYIYTIHTATGGGIASKFAVIK